ncbi:hypothetical protein [Rubripirellula reticaptiva]|uniref:Fimbrial assembly protein (PilN) n=1 Tax=Rubripirellula reticaptiva TaxID=2528013 RepID=A0A5C6ELR0_9BACT|nr:hypothetical protein [Rubripirellula reticaptiva]TWU49798.1 hypothetical protein Poly59_44230 [Rubripirellula reticaptiva]
MTIQVAEVLNAGRSPLQSFDLLPASFGHQQKLRQVRLGYATIIVALIAVFVAAAIATAVRRTQRHRNYQQIAAVAMPLMQLRQQVLQIQSSNEKRMQWIGQVESARPNDDLLQTIDSFAAATADLLPTIAIQTLHIRLPIEYAAGPAADSKTTSHVSPPSWATPKLDAIASVGADAPIDRWLTQLNQSPRVSSASAIGVQSQRDLGDKLDRPVTIKAMPISTGVLP